MTILLPVVGHGTTASIRKVAPVGFATTVNGAIALGQFPLLCEANTVGGVQGFLVKDSPSPGSIYVQPSFAVGSDKRKYHDLGTEGLLGYFIVSVTESRLSFSLSRNARFFHYSEHKVIDFATPLFPESSFLNSIPLLPCSFQSRLLSYMKSTSDLQICPSCSVFHKSTGILAFPFLAESSGDVSLYDFDASVILPLKYLKGTTKTSGFACISKIWIHPAHHNFHDTIKNQKNIFALKKLRSDHADDFKREARALHAFAVYPHNHIVRLLAAFRHDGSFYLLFPWARGGSLRSFWREHPQPTIGTEVSTWVARQSLGIAAALHEIHRQGASVEIRGYHGDVKPENILLFEGDRQGSISHVWKIGDFGVSRRFLVAPHGGDIPRGFTPTYQSPEHQINGRIDGCADIWSLGCVFLEIVVWLLWGWNGLVCFGIMRQTPNRLNEQNNINSNTFFDIVDSTPNDTPVPILKPSVLQCIESLSRDPNVSPYLMDLLHLIRRYLLDVDKHTRLSSEHLVKVLRQLHQRCLDTPAYTVAVPRPQKPPIPTTLVHCESKNHYIADLSASSNLLTLKITPQMILTYMTNPRNIAPRTNSYKYQAMSMDSGALPWSQRLDDYISQLLKETNPEPPMMESFDHLFNFSIPEEAHQSPPNLVDTQPSRRRAFSSITDPDAEDCQRKVKYQKRGETFQRSFETNPSLKNTSLHSSALSTPQLTSPSIAVTKPRMFACPFMKRSGDKYLTTKNWKCCLGPGPGWTIHRLKEHLYRKHTSSNYQCPRCLVEFEDNSNLRQHQRNTTPCLVHPNADSSIEKIEAEQVVQLKKKVRRCPGEEKWNDIYRIVFQLGPEADLPSPYHEDIAPVSNVFLGVDSLSQFQSYLQNRLQDRHETQYNTSTIRACMELIKGFQESGDSPFPPSEAPSLEFVDSAFSTMSYEPDASTAFSTTNEYDLSPSHEFEGMSADPLAGLALFDSSFETRLSQICGPLSHAKSQRNPYELDKNF